MTIKRLTTVIGMQRSGSETIPRPQLEPILTTLAEQWERDGCLVAGRTDGEWTTLTLHYP
ncbi:hypothetical protein ABZ829_36095 [Streptomyces xanthochromogenes]|uniref:hypothetical protein n=1 Tax=Streptomyces xanthochromogenes TaxID=67384 RepID=UPI00342F4348